MRWLLVLVFTCRAAVAVAQPGESAPPAPPAPSLSPEALGFDFREPFLRFLPLSDSLYPVLETMQPSLISDRFTNGGLFTGQPARVGGFQASWSQARFIIGNDVDISDPNGTGMPMLFPDLAFWSRIRVDTGLIASDVNSTGLAVRFAEFGPYAPAWQQRVSASLSHGALTAAESPLSQPTIARVAGRDRLAWSGSGPLLTSSAGTVRMAGAFGATWTRATQYDRAEARAVPASIGSALASVSYFTARQATVHAIGWYQQARTPLEYRQVFSSPDAANEENAGHLQVTWAAPPGRSWQTRYFAAYTQRARTPNAQPATGLVERLIDGPVWTALASPRGTTRLWNAGGRWRGTPTWRGNAHAIDFGLDAVGAAQHTPVSSVRVIGELTDGQPSRVWSFRNPEGPSSRGAITVSAHATDTLRLNSRLTGSVGLRFEYAHGAADGAADGITWASLLPRARLDWRLHEGGATVAFAGYTRSASRLALDLLAFGDPNAPWATVYRWDPRFAQPTPGVTSVVARVGPGTGGDANFVRIDPALDRPVSDELAFGVEMRPGERSRLQLALVGRRETGFMTLVNTGVTVAGYSATFVPDPGANTGKADDDRVIPVYSRSPATFGADQYLLTNPGLKASYSGNVELSGQYTARRLTFYGGATASISRGPAAALGYGPLENDQSVVTDSYVSPNAGTYRRGRLFNDRAFTIKLSAVYALPWDVTLGAIARYQDGQNFSRVLVVPGLAQGTEAIRAFAAGDSRFRFIAALDTRLTKGFRVAGQRVEAIVDAYNLTGQDYDVEERAAQAPNDRTPIAYQPSRVLHVGVRVGF